jgi:hypothetical protein
MKLEICYILRSQGRVRLLWKPRILTPSGPIMARAITQGSRSVRNKGPVGPYPGEDAVGSRAILLFQQQTGGLRLTDEAAADLYQLVRGAMEQEGVMP